MHPVLMRILLSVLSVIVWTGCGSGVEPEERDGGSPPPEDAGPPSPDGGVPLDVGSPDGGDRGPRWFTDDIDRGVLASLAVSDDGVVHVAHALLFNNGAGELRYSTNAAGRWETVVVKAGPRLGWNIDLALQGNEPRIVYTDPTLFVDGTGDVYLATPSGDGWVWSTPGPSGVRLDVSLVASPTGELGIAFGGGLGFEYAHSATPEWVGESISDDHSSSVVELAFSSVGVPCVAFIADDNAASYAHRTESGWVLETIEAVAEWRGIIDLAVSPDDRAWVAFPFGDVVHVAVAADDGWVVSTVGAGLDVFDLAIAVDTDGVGHIALTDATTHRVSHASSADGWAELTEIGSTGTGDSFVDLALDPAGRPHVVYSRWDTGGSHLRLVTRR